MTEFVKLFLTLGFAKVLLIILGLVAAVFVWIWFANAMAAQMAGWKQLVEKYPAPEIERPGEILQEVDRQYRQHGVQVELHGAINSGRVARPSRFCRPQTNFDSVVQNQRGCRVGRNCFWPGAIPPVDGGMGKAVSPFPAAQGFANLREKRSGRPVPQS